MGAIRENQLNSDVSNFVTMELNADISLENFDAPVKKIKKAKLSKSIPTTKSKNLDPTQLYLNEIGFSPLLTPEEEVYFARLAQKGDEAGRKRMIESNEHQLLQRRNIRKSR